ncbi:hypothetical protein COS78_02735 [Candidatus Shapirobacteria bacterium CG06_land_8_20_14_3_00_40_12]|uniref:Uncharacterized protein n=2 Tax=Candidatus Shapironibacteriota TaxID=1752721 RepID=A0A2M7TSY2_9BACT|nr:MAG: hypothetical protein COS78_02735 [Candidatus Shapirobacteria bacterium CG06_land_8_20_14_3_00_40_12]PIZ58876.1 MAG: hypothetical protein COY20_02775 [Candidatus Shapirobacteria bacterium CG_4_10_14_0_2_um_filter_40_12]
MKSLTEYQQFYGYVVGRIEDGLPLDTEYPATPKEVGFWKKFQFSRMVNHARVGEATEVEIRHLKRHGLFYPRRVRLLS